MKFILSFLLIFTIKANAQSWNPMCPGNSSRWVNNLLMKMTEADNHPFTEVCEPVNFETGEYLTAASNAEKMPLNVFIRDLPQQTKGGKSLKPFLVDVRKRIQNKINEERKKITQVKECLKSGSPDQCIKISTPTKDALKTDCQFEKIGEKYICEALLDDSSASHQQEITDCGKKRLECAKDNLAKFRNYKFSNLVRDTRFNLLLSSEPASLLGKNTGQAGALNFNMHDRGVYKEKSWDSSLGQETIEARQTLASYFSQARESLSEPYNPNSIKQKVQVDSAVNTVRQSHLQTYTAMLALNPILHFIESENPDKKEVSEAADQMLASLNKEEKWLKETTESLDSGNTLNKDLLKLFNYRNEVSEALAKDNGYCGIARDFKHLYDAKNLGKDIAITVPIVFASVFLPISSAPAKVVLGAIGAETVLAGALVANRQIEINESAYQVQGRFDPNSSKELESLSQHLSARQMEVFFGALGVMGPARIYLKNQKLLPTLYRRISNNPAAVSAP